MNNFSRFQARNRLRTNAQESLNNSFIIKGYPSIIIRNEDIAIQASVVNKQEQDVAYIYVNDKNQLDIGSIWEAKQLKLLILEEIIIIKNVGWRKYKAVRCNVQINDFWGFFKGPEKQSVSVTMKEEFLIKSNQKPVLVLQSNDLLKIRDKIFLKGRGWMIIEYDNLSTPGITYYTLEVASVSKDDANISPNEDVFIEKEEEIKINSPITEIKRNVFNVLNNHEIVLKTENGYFNFSNENIKIIKRTQNEIIFLLPFGVEECTIQIMKYGEIKTLVYKAVK